MKFQIILETGDKKLARMPDDEFQALVKKCLKMPGFKLIGGRSLEGIQARVWEPATNRRQEKDILDD